MEIETLIHARWVLPISEGSSVLEHSCVAVDKGKIITLCSSQEANDQFKAINNISLSDHVLMPGLINAHSHTPMTLFRGLADDIPLMSWLNDHIWPAEGKWVKKEFVADGTKLAIAEMIKSGTTSFNDMYFFPETISKVAIEAGIRCNIGLILIDFPTVYAQDSADYFEKALEVHDQIRHEKLINSCFAPHAPYSVSDETLKKMLSVVNELELPIHMHVHETKEEIQESMKKYGMRPIKRLQKLGLMNSSMIAVHMTQITENEIQILAKNKVNVVHCPESNLKLASGFCPVQRLAEFGVNIGIGTDGAASNNDLDMFGEMRTAALLGKGVAENASALPAKKVLEMATINGAKALGQDHKIGSLETGKEADIIALDLGSFATKPLYNLESQIVYAVGKDQVSDVWVAGRQIMKQKVILSLDAKKIMEKTAFWQKCISDEDKI